MSRYINAVKIMSLLAISICQADEVYDQSVIAHVNQYYASNSCAERCTFQIQSSDTKIDVDLTRLKIDLNSDGKPDYVLSSIENCGASACIEALLASDDRKLIMVFEGQNIAYLPKSTKGFRDLVQGLRGAGQANFGAPGKLELYRWNGKAYVDAGLIDIKNTNLTSIHTDIDNMSQNIKNFSGEPDITVKKDQNNAGFKLTAVVNTPGDGFLSLRSEPNAKQGIRLDKIPHATPLDIGECISSVKAERWCNTTYQGQTGWILDRYLIKETKGRENTATAEATTLPKGNADRKAILDVIRAGYSRPVIFVVHHLKKSGDWVWIMVSPQTKAGVGDGEEQLILLQKKGKVWQKVDGLDLGADCGEEYCPETDIATLRRRHPNAPASIFD